MTQEPPQITVCIGHLDRLGKLTHSKNAVTAKKIARHVARELGTLAQRRQAAGDEARGAGHSQTRSREAACRERTGHAAKRRERPKPSKMSPMRSDRKRVPQPGRWPLRTAQVCRPGHGLMKLTHNDATRRVAHPPTKPRPAGVWSHNILPEAGKPAAVRGRVGEGGRSCCARCVNNHHPPLAPPHRKSGLPDLRTIRRDPGKPGARGEGNTPSLLPR
jgi:hypothetical protein